MVFTRGRSRGSLNRNKSNTTGGRDRVEEQQRALNNSTCRELSRFEYTQAIDFTSSVQIPSSQPSSSMQPSPTQNIRPPTSYLEPSMFELSFISYFQQSSQLDLPPSAQSLSSQVYSQPIRPRTVQQQEHQSGVEAAEAAEEISSELRGRGEGGVGVKRLHAVESNVQIGAP